MRHLIDTYIRAEESEKVSAFNDLSLVQLIVERGTDAIEKLPKGIRQNKEAVAETIENNVRKLIINEQPINPKYYEKMSDLLDALIQKRKQSAIEYSKYLEQIVELTKQVVNPVVGAAYPSSLNTSAKRALYDNLQQDEGLALEVDAAVCAHRQDEWRGNVFKVKKVRLAIKGVLFQDELTETILELVKNQAEY